MFSINSFTTQTVYFLINILLINVFKIFSFFFHITEVLEGYTNFAFVYMHDIYNYIRQVLNRVSVYLVKHWGTFVYVCVLPVSENRFLYTVSNKLAFLLGHFAYHTLLTIILIRFYLLAPAYAQSREGLQHRNAMFCRLKHLHCRTMN